MRGQGQTNLRILEGFLVLIPYKNQMKAIIQRPIRMRLDARTRPPLRLQPRRTLSNPTLNRDDFRLFPNPVAQQFSISEMSYKTVIYSISGQKVMTSTEKKNRFQVAFLPSGFYFVKFELEKNRTQTMYLLKN